jgi:hypothetical protein
MPDTGLLLFGKPVVVWGGRFPFVKLAEFFQTIWGEVVEGLFGPIISVRIVEPLHDIQDTPALLG